MQACFSVCTGMLKIWKFPNIALGSLFLKIGIEASKWVFDTMYAALTKYGKGRRHEIRKWSLWLEKSVASGVTLPWSQPEMRLLTAIQYARDVQMACDVYLYLRLENMLTTCLDNKVTPNFSMLRNSLSLCPYFGPRPWIKLRCNMLPSRA